MTSNRNMRMRPDWPLFVISPSEWPPVQHSAIQNSLRRSSEVSCRRSVSVICPIISLHRPTIVTPSGILHRYRNAVVALGAVAEVVLLEVERGLGEAVHKRDIVHGVDYIKRIRACGVDVHGHRRRLVRVLGEDELARRRLARQVRLRALERDCVVPAVMIRFVSPALLVCQLCGMGKRRTHEVVVVVVVPSLCQPLGEAAVF